MRKQLKCPKGAFVALVLIVFGAACGGESDSDAQSADGGDTSTSEAASESIDPGKSQPETTDSASVEPAAALTGTELCEAVTAEAMAAASGLPITNAVSEATDQFTGAPLDSTCVYQWTGGELKPIYLADTTTATAMVDGSYVGADGFEELVAASMVDNGSATGSPTSIPAEAGTKSVVITDSVFAEGIVLVDDGRVLLVRGPVAETGPTMPAVLAAVATSLQN